jgi:hypothetical protein
MFRPRKAVDKYGRVYVNFSPGVSREALKTMRQTVRGWHLQLMSDKELNDLWNMFGRGVRGGEEFRELFCVLQSGSTASGFGISDARSDVLWKRSWAAKTGDATGQSSLRSSLLCDAGVKLFCGKRREGGKKEKRSKKEKNGGLWKLTPPMEIRKQCGFPPRLEKSLAKSARLFHSSDRPHSSDRFRICFGQRSTLERPLFCLKNGEHLKDLISQRRGLGRELFSALPGKSPIHGVAPAP